MVINMSPISVPPRTRKVREGLSRQKITSKISQGNESSRHFDVCSVYALSALEFKTSILLLELDLYQWAKNVLC